MTNVLWTAGLLSLERLFYIWICWAPGSFVALCRIPWSGTRLDPVVAVERFFYLFKAVQMAVLGWWCVGFDDGHGWLSGGAVAIGCGAFLIVAGQALNTIVFRQLGRTGVFYGGQFGSRVSWRSGFPFSWFRHPQYAGAVMTIWGVFLLVRYPAPDWAWLPMLESTYYWLSTRLERYEGVWHDVTPAPPVHSMKGSLEN